MALPVWPPARPRRRSPIPRPTPRPSCRRHGNVIGSRWRWRCFPELALSAYAIDDLLMQDVLLDAVEAAVDELVAESGELMPLLLVGAPVRHAGRIYNAALAIHRGQLLGVVPKIHLPNYREFYERRHFASGDGTEGGEIRIGSRLAPFGPDLLFAATDLPGLVVHAEICEDLWVPVPPSAVAALGGATVLANLSASNITVGKADTRRLLCRHNRRAAWRPTSMPRQARANRRTSPGTDRHRSSRSESSLPPPTAFLPASASPSRTSIWTCCARNGCAWVPSTTTAAATLRRPAFRTVRSSWRRLSDLGLLRTVDRFPFVPTTRHVSPRTATRPTISRFRAWSSALAPTAASAWSSASRAASIPPRP